MCLRSGKAADLGQPRAVPKAKRQGGQVRATLLRNPKTRALCPNKKARKCAQKGCFSGVFEGKRGVKRAYLGPRKPEKRRFFAYRRGNWRAQRGFRAIIRHYVSANARPKSTPRDDVKGATDESP